MFNSNRNTNYNPNDNTSSWKRQAARYIAWTPVVHPAAVTLMFLVLALDVKVGLPFELVGVLLCVIPVIESRLLRREVGPRRLVMWAKVARFRRHWFTVWTANVNAQSDHTTQGLGLIPVLSYIPRFKNNIGYFTVRPPQKHTLEYITEVADVLASHSPGVTKINVIYKRPTDSEGIFQVIFGETNPVTNPDWASPLTTTPPTPTRSAFPQNPTTSTTPKDQINEPV